MRRRLVWAIAGTSAVAVVLLAVPLGIVLERNYRDEDLLLLQRDTIAATRQIDVGGRSGDPVELPAGPDVLAAYDRAGRRIAGRGPAVAPGVVREALRTGRPADATGTGRLIVAVPLLNGERVVGAVRAQRDDAGAQHDANSAWLVIGAVAAAIIALATLAAMLLARGLARPLERLGASARRLGDGDFSARSAPSGIAEVDAVGAALDATAEQLDALVTRERAFTADASHQLRTPLQALRIELEAMELRGADAPELPAALAQVDRLQTTIDTLLAVARDMAVPGAQTDLAAMLDAVAERWTGPLAGEGRPLRLRPGGEASALATASPGVVAEILEVLLDNARRHGTGAVTVTTRALEGWIAVEVADEGPGLGDDPERAFARRSPDADGHGIGLVLARSLAHAEGGRLTARAGPQPVLTLMLRGRGTADGAVAPEPGAAPGPGSVGA
jgi:signal transduction histidine kinase